MKYLLGIAVYLAFSSNLVEINMAVSERARLEFKKTPPIAQAFLYLRAPISYTAAALVCTIDPEACHSYLNKK